MIRYLRRWLPFWTHCALVGATVGCTIGVAIAAAVNAELAPLYLVLLEASLAYLHTVRGHRVLVATLQRAVR